jgi:RNA-directed DNA polymerase
MNDGSDIGGAGEQLVFFHEDGRAALPPPADNPQARRIYTFENLWRAYRECRRTKRATLNALAFEIDAERGLLELQDTLLSHRYRPGTSICFVTDGPKPREVFAADFRDRIVHHLLVREVEPLFERRFIHDSWACRRGRGVLAASDRLTGFLRQATANRAQPAWALKLDVANFFPSIHRATLYDILCRVVGNPELRWLTATLLFHDPTTDYVFHPGPRRVPPPGDRRYPVEARKSLFAGDGCRGLPIGNLTSQFWANVYLNEVDQFVKRRLRVRWYLRYVDDLVLLARDPEQLRAWRDAIRSFVDQRLRLHLRTDGDEPTAVARGVDFVGWRTWASHRVPRRRTLAALDERIRQCDRSLRRKRSAGEFDVLDLTRTMTGRPGVAATQVLVTQRLSSTLACYSGHLRHGSAWRAWTAMWKCHRWLEVLCRHDGWDCRLRWDLRDRAYSSLWRQYSRIAGAAGPKTLVFCPVGAFVEFRGPYLAQACEVLGLARLRLPRGVWAFGAGFPVRVLAAKLVCATAAGWSVALVRQGPWRGQRACRARHVAALAVPTAL